MKLKYYMRGLGIGIILTTLILTIGNPKEKLTDQEIIRRAKVLGMEMKEESNLDLDKVLQSVKPSGAPTGEPSGTPEGEPTATPTAVPTAEPTVEPTVVPTVEPTAVPTKESTPEETEDSLSSSMTQPSVEIKKEDEIFFTIENGMSSRKVSVLLMELGLIEDSVDFNEYIQTLGKTGVIRMGSYSITKGASYDEIIDIISK